ncbi:MAG: hypothetical protein Q9211_004208 [Gyalolechia sp. 1 TL-2023]
MGDSIDSNVLDQLATGFGALLEQVRELDKRNAHLEHLLDRMQEQVRVNQTTASPAHPVSSIPSIYQKDTTGPSQESGLHIECENNQLHLGKVSENIKWHITDGFKAWTTLRCDGIGRYPPLDGFLAARQQHPAQDPRPANSGKKQASISQCPLVPQQVSHEIVSDLRKAFSIKNGSIREDHVRSEDTIEDPIAAETGPTEVISHHPSQTAPVSKCPIRFLDQHSPEDVAAYFKNHSHELPRSHEICVRRYQRNDDQIRQLDHKYGNLVNMIQGLGQKHQPMLHTKADGGNQSQAQTSQRKVEAWAKEVKDDLKAQANHGVGEETSSLRDNHFDRPLKEIRVGESPSRPWGISVPQAAQAAPSAASGHGDPDWNGRSPLPPELPTPSSHPQEPIRTSSPPKLPSSTAGQPKMVFTGPVFIGYSPEQITDVLQRAGLGKASGG